MFQWEEKKNVSKTTWKYTGHNNDQDSKRIQKRFRQVLKTEWSTKEINDLDRKKQLENVLQ